MVVPGLAVRQLRRDVLAEQARDVLPRGASVSSSVEGISISTIGLAAPAVRARIEIGAVHVGEGRRDDDAGGEVIAVAAAAP